MKVVQIRPNTYSLTATSQEIGALVAAARMAADVLRSDPRAPREALGLLESVLADWDAAIAREGRESAPPPGPLLDADP